MKLTDENVFAPIPKRNTREAPAVKYPHSKYIHIHPRPVINQPFLSDRIPTCIRDDRCGPGSDSTAEGYASSGISSSLSSVPLQEWKNFTLWRFLPFTGGSQEFQPFRCDSAAFFNESINRDIITGRYLKHALVPYIREIKPIYHSHNIAANLIGATESVMRVVITGIRGDLRSRKELDRFLGTRTGCH